MNETTGPRTVQAIDPSALTPEQWLGLQSDDRIVSLAAMMFGEVVADPKHSAGWVGLIEKDGKMWCVHVSPAGDIAQALKKAEIEIASLRIASAAVIERHDQALGITSALLSCLRRLHEAEPGKLVEQLCAEIDSLRDEEHGELPWEGEEGPDHG